MIALTEACIGRNCTRPEPQEERPSCLSAAMKQGFDFPFNVHPKGTSQWTLESFWMPWWVRDPHPHKNRLIPNRFRKCWKFSAAVRETSAPLLAACCKMPSAACEVSQ